MAPRSPKQQPSVCACVNVRRASRAITKIYDQALESSGLKLTQFSLLKNIEAYGPLNISALGKLLVLDRTTLVRNLKLLETAGFIENTPSPDPRERQVSITEHGRQTVKRAMPQWREVQRQLSCHIGAEQLQVLGRLVTSLEGLAHGHDTLPGQD